MYDHHRLAPFEGQEVITTGVEISNAAGGLNDALSVDPQSWMHGDSLIVVLRCDVTKVRFDPVKGAEDKLRRVHVMRATDATVGEEGLLDDLERLINEQRDRIRRSREAEEGIDPLPFSDPEALDEEVI
jgi:hypothetical protein